MTRKNQTLYRAMRRCINRRLSWKFFKTSEIYGLDEMSQYISFVDNVSSLEDLREGLGELSPFADDALAVAQSMTESDFCNFKLALPFERRGDGSKTPRYSGAILLPERFVPAVLLAEQAGAPLGATLIRLLETELGM